LIQNVVRRFAAFLMNGLSLPGRKVEHAGRTVTGQL
jgi:hypothetical protein